MGVRCLKGARIRGVASCVPRDRRVVTEEIISAGISAKRFSSLTGVKESRTAYVQGFCTSDLCYEAAQTLMAQLGWSGTQIDTLIFVSQSRDYVVPMTACILQDRLGIGRSCLALDIPSGCAGFIHGLAAIASLLTANQGKRGLLVAGEVNKIDACGLDNNTNFLFGDAGSACAVELEPNSNSMFFDFGTDGSGFKSLYAPAGGFRYPISRNDFDFVEDSDGVKHRPIDFIVDGAKIFEFATSAVPASVCRVLEHANLSADEVDSFIIHQANKLINETIRNKLKIPAEKHPYSIDLFGNTSSASIPLTMTARLLHKLETGVNKLILCGFGVGLSWASAYIETDSLCCPELIEL